VALQLQAERLDPRSVSVQGRLGTALRDLRRYPEAREVFERGLAFAPANLSLIERKAMTFLGEGDLAGARGALEAAPKEVEPTTLVAYVANFNDLVWLLDEQQRELLQRRTPSAFDNDKGVWGLCLTQAFASRQTGPTCTPMRKRRGRPSKSSFRPLPRTASVTLCSASYWLTWAKGGGDPGRNAWHCPRSSVGQR
jgi:hypothetical protein